MVSCLKQVQLEEKERKSLKIVMTKVSITAKITG